MRGGVAQQYYAKLRLGEANSAFSLNDQIGCDFWLEELRLGAIDQTGGAASDISSQLEWGLKVGRMVCTAGAGTSTTNTVPVPASSKLCYPRTQLNFGEPVKSFTTIIRFDKPVYVPANQRIIGTLKNAANPPVWGAGPSASIEGWMTAVGRRAQPNEKPDVIHVPWFSSWKSPLSAVGAGVVYQYRSPDHALANGNEQPIYVQRMLGALATGAIVGEVMPCDVRISDSNQRYIVRELTPMYELFSYQQRDWDMGCILKPKEFLNVEVSFDTSPLVAAGNFSTGYVAADQVQAFFGLAGYREMQFHEVYQDLSEPAQPVVLIQQPGPQVGTPVRIAGPRQGDVSQMRPWNGSRP